MKKLLAIFVFFIAAGAAHAAGGSCPTGANYLNLTTPQTGGGLGSVTLASLGITNCYYISSSGLDTNTGTTESAPWLHAPGMPACTATCASTTPTAGEGFIFEGGSVWHRSSGSPLTGGEWTWSYNGTSANPIYIGIDPTWYSGSSFARPVFNQDNPISSTPPSSCSFADDGTTFFGPSGTYLIVDGFEWTGNCQSGSGDDSVIGPATMKNETFERQYIHGWSTTTAAGDDGGVKIGQANSNPHDDTDRLLFNVIDGSDSTYGNTCTTPSCAGSGRATGWAVSDGWDVEYSVITHVSNGIQAGEISTIIGNSLSYMFEPSLSG